MRFFDASALVPRYVRQERTAKVRRLLGDGDVAVSRLSEVEVVSAFARLCREGAISAEQRDRAATAFVADLAAWHVVEMIPDVVRSARTLLLRRSLRAGDAIQLAAALVLQAALGDPLRAFVVYDQRLAAAAQAELLTVISD
jgi:predicted nucleic acid-binding protein